MARKVYTPKMDAWILANYGRGGSSSSILDSFAAEFGWRPTLRGFRVRASRLGVKLGEYSRDAPDRAVREVRFGEEPEMQRWMLANAGAGSVADVSRGFAAEFGFPLSRPQVVNWRMRNGYTSRRSTSRSKVPVGTVKASQKGFLVVKVAMRPTVRCTKDNWRPLSRVKWEQYNGRPLPEGHVVLFANRNSRDFRQDNLVAVPKRLVGRVNASDSPGWDDAESLKACIAWCELGCAISAAERQLPRRCGVCGVEFVPQNDWQGDIRTCPSCVAAGHRAKGRRRAKSGPATARCAVCGEEFTKEQVNQCRCRRCIERWPRHSASQARRIYEKERKNGRVR